METNRRGYPENAGSNLSNLMAFVCKSIIKTSVSTAIPVRVDSVDPIEGGAGFVSATPLIAQRDQEGNSLGSVSIPRLPYFRYYAGRCAIVCDPVVGDIGLAVFAQADCSLITKDTKDAKVAGSFRTFDMADGFYLGGFYKGGGDTNVVFDQEGNITVNAPKSVTVNTEAVNVNTKTANVKADTLTVDCPSSKFTGTVAVDGNISTKQDLTANGLSFLTHVHGGVQTGTGDTGAAK